MSRSRIAPIGSGWLSKQGGIIQSVLRYERDAIILSDYGYVPNEKRVELADLCANYTQVRDARGRPHRQNNGISPHKIRAKVPT